MYETINNDTIKENADVSGDETERTDNAENTRKHGKVAEYVKRTAYLCVGLFIMSFAIALSIKAELGTSPISSTPYVLNSVRDYPSA